MGALRRVSVGLGEKYCHSREKISLRVASTALSALSCVGPDLVSNGAPAVKRCASLFEIVWRNQIVLGWFLA